MSGMSREQRFKFLSLFGDAKPYNWFRVVFFGVKYLKVSQAQFERWLQRSIVDDGLVKRVGKAANYKDDDYIITAKGDECLRNEQISRGGDYSYFKTFDRTPKSAERLAPVLNKFMNGTDTRLN